ncbi:hypothetical protein [Nevskia ramosa]|uniref:hypothetical protein n=1 Tax=Nevskia ramosa TaxID=64002 RepID=UPI0023547C8D|nr:hypothetical protein [Nevskia ramosa]
MSPNERLRAFAERSGLSGSDLASMFGVSVSLVRGWFCKAESARFRPMRKPYVLILDEKERGQAVL